MSVTIKCSNCGASLHPTGRSPRVRCEFCSADVVIDADILSELAQAVPIAPPELMARFHGVFNAVLSSPEKLVHELAHRLERALPGQVEVEKHGLLHSTVSRVAAQIGDWRYEIAYEAAKLVAHRKHQVRGIALKSTPLNASELISALAGELHELSLQPPPDNVALAKFFGG